VSRVRFAIVGLLAGPALAQVTVAVPQRFVDRVGPVLARELGDAVVVSPTSAITTIPAADVHLLFDEWTLFRVGSVVELAWETEYGVAVVEAAFAGEGTQHDWEALALRSTIDGRFGVVAPEVDGAPWLLAMHDVLPRRGVNGVAALWTTLDARAGRLLASDDALANALRAGTLDAAVGPLALLGSVVSASGARLRLDRLRGDSRVALGAAIAIDARAEVRSIFERLRDPALQQAVADAAGLVRQRRATSLAPSTALAWWQQFETQVRGRGKSLERLAEGFDWVFGALFLLCCWLLWRTLRREPAHLDSASGNVP